jgi:hypothetical protein
VTKAIRDAMDRIPGHDPALARHLRHAIHTGALCSYEPDPRTNSRWLITG